jgi:hypothetical protein
MNLKICIGEKELSHLFLQAVNFVHNKKHGMLFHFAL